MNVRIVFRFLLAGAVLFGLAHAFASPPRRFVAGAAREMTDEDVLADAAVARGVDRDDPVVQRRLVRNMAFLDGDGCDPPALYREALGLGLGSSDLVVRRRLAQRMRLTLEAAARAVEPGDADLAAYLATHTDVFTVPARATVTQVFVSRRRATWADEARRLRDQLAAGADPAVRGDALPLPATLTQATVPQLAAWLGSAVAEAAFAAPLDAWQGPIESPYGAHLLRVDERWAAVVPPLADVREAVREAWLEARANAAVADTVRAWRSATRDARRDAGRADAASAAATPGAAG
ncbi:MAG: peptidylprolyl isomerase [bacterium]